MKSLKVKINVSISFMNEEKVVDGIAEFESNIFAVPSFVIEKSGFKIRYQGKDFEIKDSIFDIDKGVLNINKDVNYLLQNGQSVEQLYEVTEIYFYPKDYWEATDFHTLT